MESKHKISNEIREEEIFGEAKINAPKNQTIVHDDVKEDSVREG